MQYNYDEYQLLIKFHLNLDETKSNWLLTATSKIQSKIEEIQFNITGYNGIESCFGDIGGNTN